MTETLSPGIMPLVQNQIRYQDKFEMLPSEDSSNCVG
jgi:hypothetical protein